MSACCWCMIFSSMSFMLGSVWFVSAQNRLCGSLQSCAFHSVPRNSVGNGPMLVVAIPAPTHAYPFV